MRPSYPVYDISSAQPEWIEQMGSKPKFWLRRPDDDQPWLFKFSREGTGEDWAEKIAAEIASGLQIHAATVELARFNGRRGSISRSFVMHEEGWDLVHGNELLASYVPGYKREMVFHQSAHTFDNIVTVLRRLFRQPQLDVQLQQLAGYLVLDALIGNTDRHHENWGLLRRMNRPGAIEETLAPSFDHASSLGRNVPAGERARRLQEESLEVYLRRGRGGIFWTELDRRGANPLGLVVSAAPRLPDAFQPWAARLRALSSSTIHDIIEAVPGALMDETAKRFAQALIDCARTQLVALH